MLDDGDDPPPKVGDPLHVRRRLGHAGDVADAEDFAHRLDRDPELLGAQMERHEVELHVRRRGLRLLGEVVHGVGEPEQAVAPARHRGGGGRELFARNLCRHRS